MPDTFTDKKWLSTISRSDFSGVLDSHVVVVVVVAVAAAVHPAASERPGSAAASQAFGSKVRALAHALQSKAGENKVWFLKCFLLLEG